MTNLLQNRARCVSMPLSFNVYMYYDSTHIHIKWLAEVRGGGVPLKYLLFPLHLIIQELLEDNGVHLRELAFKMGNLVKHSTIKYRSH